MNLVRLKHSTALGPGTWCFDAGGAVVVACGECGGTARLDHRILDNGTIEPSLVCPHDPCRWHVRAVLEGYDEAARRR